MLLASSFIALAQHARNMYGDGFCSVYTCSSSTAGWIYAKRHVNFMLLAVRTFHCLVVEEERAVPVHAMETYGKLEVCR